MPITNSKTTGTTSLFGILILRIFDKSSNNTEATTMNLKIAFGKIYDLIDLKQQRAQIQN